jgi:hypothetical protein
MEFERLETRKKQSETKPIWGKAKVERKNAKQSQFEANSRPINTAYSSR